MRVRIIPSAIAVLLTLTACDTLPTAPANQRPARTLSASRSALFDATSASDPNCPGSTVAGVARNWPWAHVEKSDFFAPPPGGMALLIEQQGDLIGVSNVRQYEQHFCTQ